MLPQPLAKGVANPFNIANVSVPDTFREIIRYTVQGSRFKVERTRKQETGGRKKYRFEGDR